MALASSSHKQLPRVLSTFSLVMINVIAVDSLRSLPLGATYGLQLIFFYAIVALLFFIPSILISAELATGWPNTGGIYVWVREAFGVRSAFITIWLQWIYNVVWYPTILSFLAATFIYLWDPQLVNNKGLMFSIILVMFWGVTLLNCFGMRASSWLSTLGAIVGTILPMLMIIGLGFTWLYLDKPTSINFSWQQAFPSVTSLSHFSFVVALLFGLVGMEMSAAHAEEVRNPQRNYPRALMIAGIIILSTLVLASIAIAIVVPPEKINLVSGLMQAFSAFFHTLNLPWLLPLTATLIIIGSLSGVGAWLIGPTKGLLTAARDGCTPQLLQMTNRKGVPVAILILQGILFSLIASAFLFMPNVSSSYWILSDLTAQLALLVYIFMFSAAIKLRYKHPMQKRQYRIPGRFGMWITAGVGLITCLSALILGFIPPEQVAVGNIWVYESFLVIGLLLFSGAPILIYQAARKTSSATPVN